VNDDERWEAWCADFDEAIKELHALFHTRYMWKVVVLELMAQAVPRQHVATQNYFVRTYVHTMASPIRRETDRDSRTTSLGRCLAQLIACPHVATRERYRELIKHENQAELAGFFDTFAGPGQLHIDPAKVEADHQRLEAAAKPVKRYVDKVIAHRERGGKEQKILISFDDINNVLDVIAEIAEIATTACGPPVSAWAG
jgi:hypothetical protein